jgi:hypothetical protein
MTNYEKEYFSTSQKLARSFEFGILRASCPECGFIYNQQNPLAMASFRENKKRRMFVCFRCKISMPLAEFNFLNADKYSSEADLSNE